MSSVVSGYTQRRANRDRVIAALRRQGAMTRAALADVGLSRSTVQSVIEELLAGQTPPPALQNGTTVDPADPSITEPASLLTPVWVTKANMESTVVADKFDPASAICAIAGASACSAAGIS